MDYRQLKYFLAVCDHLNVTAAAASICISEQALSRSVRNLEDELHARLFKRTGKGVELTDRGRELQREARDYVDRHDAILSRFAREDGGREPRLVVAASTGAMAQWFPEHFLADFVLSHCGLDFELRCFSEDPYNRPFASTDLDLVLCTSPVYPADWWCEVHARNPIRLLMGGNDPLAAYDQVPLGALAGRRVAIAVEETPGQDRVGRLLAQAGCVPCVRFGPSEIGFVEDLVVNGQLVTLFGGNDANRPRGTVLRPVEGFQDVYWELSVLRRTSVALPTAGRELVRLMRACLLPPAAGSAGSA